MAEPRRWINQSQPQTLVIGVYLLYFDAVFLFLLGGAFSAIGLLMVAASAAGGYGIANEKKWGYMLGVGISAFRLLLLFASGGNPVLDDPIALLFAGAQLALLLHPQSREYQRVWFK
jgi:hypothetical protein